MVEFQESCVCSVYKSFSRYAICKYFFFPVNGLSFILLKASFVEQKFNFSKGILSNFSPIDLLPVLKLKVY